VHIGIGFKFIGLLALKNISFSTTWAFIGNDCRNKIFGKWFWHNACEFVRMMQR
jgi:hypothetical protein